MTRADFFKILEPLILTLGGDTFDTPTRSAYFRVLQDVPANVFAAAVARVEKMPLKFMPRPGELRAYAEEERIAMLAAIPYLPCATCDETGWEPVTTDGIVSMRRCGCWTRHQAMIAALGIGQAPLVLPAGAPGAP